MFYSCLSINSLDISGFDTYNVLNFESMFSGCKTLVSLDLSNFNNPLVYNTRNMFYYCVSLESLKFGYNFKTKNVISMEGMFDNCRKLKYLDVSTF